MSERIPLRHRIADDLYDHFARHAETYARGLFYGGGSALNVWLLAIGDKAGPELWSIIANRWFPLLLSSIIAAGIAFMAQMDLQRASVPPKGTLPKGTLPEGPHPPVSPATPPPQP